ncbi:MAG: hypothetical protein V3V08_16360 [Nannocystaceae bacterium]
MRCIVWALFLAAPLLAFDAGCKPATKTVQPHIDLPRQISDETELARGLNAYVLMPVSDPARGSYRELLLTYLLDVSERALDDGEHERSVGAMERAVDLYTPAELRAANLAEPRTTQVALKIYQAAAREGREFPAAFALGVAEAFGSAAVRTQVAENWALLVDWIERGHNYPTQLHQQPPIELQDVLEQANAAFPSPWLTDELASIYRAQIPILRDVDAAGLENRRAHRSRADFAGFLLIRAYLRADDFDGANDALVVLASREQTRTFRDLVSGATEPSDTAQPLNDLIDYLQPDPDPARNSSLPPWLITQAWGIVENLARRALTRAPEDAHANLARAHSLRQLGLVDASITHFERAIAAKEDVFDAWSTLAEMYQQRLEREADDASDRGTSALQQLEKFHHRAAKLWSDRPIRPGLPDAYLTVATAHYRAGSPEKALPLLKRSTALEPLPGALHLLGTIELWGGQLIEARQRYDALLNLPFPDQAERIDWEIQARERLGLIALRSGDKAAARKELKSGLRQLNLLLSLPNLPDREHSARLVDRYRILFMLGEIDLAMADFRSSISATPGQPSTYAQTLLLTTSHAYYNEALEVYRRAMNRHEVPASLKLYFSLWIFDLAQQQGKAAEPRAREFLTGYEGEPWHMMLAQHALGLASFDQLTKRAKTAGERAEAYFYEGLRRWRIGEEDRAVSLMKRVVSTRMMSFFEYEMAQIFLARRSLPMMAETQANTVPRP